MAEPDDHDSSTIIVDGFDISRAQGTSDRDPSMTFHPGETFRHFRLETATPLVMNSIEDSNESERSSNNSLPFLRQP